MPAFELLRSRFVTGDFFRVVAFGSSNTARTRAGMHWFDCFEVACRKTLGTNFTCINTGRGGHTTRDLLERIDRDCLFYQPGVVFITIGGNDCNPAKEVSAQEYRSNLLEIIRRIREVGGEPLLQTYYSFDVPNMEAERAQAFFERMQDVREVAEETGASLIDHLRRWERLRAVYPAVYLRLMADAAHVIEAGNLLLGVDIVRRFGLNLPDDPCFREARALQVLLDQLEERGSAE